MPSTLHDELLELHIIEPIGAAIPVQITLTLPFESECGTFHIKLSTAFGVSRAAA